MRMTSCLAAKLALVVLLVIPALSDADTNPASNPSASAQKELVFLNWPEYMDPEVIREFERRFNAKVKQVYFADDDARDNILTDSDGQGYDVVDVIGPQLTAYRKRGWLAPLDESTIPNLRHIGDKWKTAYPDAAGYAVPYFWGTLGIGYRPDLVPEKITRWKQLYQPAEPLRGKIAMNSVGRELVGMALKALGHSANSADSGELAAAERLLRAQKPYVKSYGQAALNEESALVKGIISAAMMYNGDVLTLQGLHPGIVYALPEEGGEIWVDYLVVMRASRNPELAQAFINFLHEPEIMARIANFVHYAPTSTAAERHLPADFLQNPTIYPDQQALEKSEFFGELPPRAMKRRNAIVSEIMN